MDQYQMARLEIYIDTIDHSLKMIRRLMKEAMPNRPPLPVDAGLELELEPPKPAQPARASAKADSKQK
jgi:hypothetical protein